MISLLKKHKLIIGAVLLGLLLRTYNLQQLFAYGHDQDLSGWFIRDVLENKHLRLIGQETSTQGIFIGPLFYYSLIPFYLLTGLDPIGGTILVTILGLFTIWSTYFVFKNIVNKEAGIIGAFIYSLSFYTVFNDREVVPTMPAILWTVWFLWGLYLILRGKFSKGLFLSGLLAGIIWHINVGLAIVLPLVPVAMILGFSKSKNYNLALKSVLGAIAVFLFMSLPLVLFEVRHGFTQKNALLASLTTDQQDIVDGYEKVNRVFHLLSKNFSGVIWGDYFGIRYEYVFLAFVTIFAVLVFRGLLDKKLAIILGLWVFIYIAFFSSYSKIVSEYYLNGAIVIFLLVISTTLSFGYKNIKYRALVSAFLILFTIVNLDRFLNIEINKSGYIERKEIIKEIKKDSEARGYPCVSISYITNPGYDRGYRYFMWLDNLKTKEISDKVPVYSIIFPLKPIFETHKTHGAIGLIYPDYPTYQSDSINEACQGENFNLVNPMIGFTN